MTGCGVIPDLSQVSGTSCVIPASEAVSDTALVIPAPEPVSMGVVVGWSRGMWMPDQVQHDGVWGHTGPRAGIHDCGRDVVQWPMDAGSSPA
ncbi:hypothetical protein [Zhongshania aliphaticivorans]|uniref:hypothetical protein n=1 Tax=Zhongshania aliphaticivorans TaxID=1470434 RepID=UPI0039C94E28